MATSIFLKLEDDLIDGIRLLTMPGRTAEALAFPFSALKTAKQRHADLFKRSGLYLLNWRDAQGQVIETYIGKTENFQTRIPEHKKKKNQEQAEWRECVIFTTSNNLLNLAHISYGEASLIQ